MCFASKYIRFRIVKQDLVQVMLFFIAKPYIDLSMLTGEALAGVQHCDQFSFYRPLLREGETCTCRRMGDSLLVEERRLPLGGGGETHPWWKRRGDSPSEEEGEGRLPLGGGGEETPPRRRGDPPQRRMRRVGESPLAERRLALRGGG